MKITDIEKLTYKEIKKLALEEIKIKEHDCFLVDLGGYFGYSIIVFKNEKQVFYANDYELHHPSIIKECGKAYLKEYYITSLNNKLFTNKELFESISSYDEYRRKLYFLRNYWIMRYDYVSSFAISEKDRKKVEYGKKSHPFYSVVSFCYVNDNNIVKDQIKIYKHLEKNFIKLKNNNEKFREMISYELSNHEACISCEATTTLDSLGLSYEELTEEQKHIVTEELNKQIESYC